jgi:perosamine synthetase
MSKIPIYKPYLDNREKDFVMDCLETSWISSKGGYIEKFENKVRKFTGANFCASTSNGTCALHLAFLALGIGKGDEVITTNFTYVASTNAILYVGAKPVFSEINNDLNADPRRIEQKITPQTKAILVTNIYGFLADYDQLEIIAKKHNLFIIEDAAESFGAVYKNRNSGTLGDISIFSFFGNKTITTGEGGMVLCKNEEHYKKVLKLKNQGNSESETYYHDILGYNYRMTNIQAAIGLAQMEKINKILSLKKSVYNLYKINLKKNINFIFEIPDTKPSYWMTPIIFNNQSTMLRVKEILESNDIETRPFFYPIDELPFYQFSHDCKKAKTYSQTGILLPSYPELREFEINKICDLINSSTN